ncbi:MAG: hypothetical protein K0S65_5150 [Labilithrix sp.]|nr:hypothetical protein [Labilithrix sp.]
MKSQWLDDFSLDGDPGPAAPLASDEATVLAASIVERAFTPGGGGGPLRRGKTFLAIATVSGALVVAGLSFHQRAADPRCADGTCGDRAVVERSSSPVALPVVRPAESIETVSVTALPDATASATASPPRPLVAGASPSDLLAEANRARRDHEWTRAASLYERVMGSRADEAYAATVALASLRLEHLDDPRGALDLYERALAIRPGGVLTAQAEAGAARCRRVLGASP